MLAKDKDLIAYCGLYCGDCFNHKDEIADLARDLRKKLREAKFDRVSIEQPSISSNSRIMKFVMKYWGRWSG